MTSFYLGKALLLIGKTDAAAEALQRSIDRKPEKSEALQVFTALGRLYSRSQQKDKALAVWKQLEATFPGDVRVGEQIARTLAEEGQNEAALERYQLLAKQASATDESRAVGLHHRSGRDQTSLGTSRRIAQRVLNRCLTSCGHRAGFMPMFVVESKTDSWELATMQRSLTITPNKLS